MEKPAHIQLWTAVAVCCVADFVSSSGREANLNQEQRIAVADTQPAAASNSFYVGNRPPLLLSPFVKLPIGAIRPRGWLRTQLTLEAEGFSGRLAEISEFLKRDNNAWLSPNGAGEHGWEEVPYWLKGFGDLGYVLGDERISKEARVWIDGVLGSQRPDGYFGPESNLHSQEMKGKADLWPNMIMLNALQSYYEYSGDRRVIDLMTEYFHWELQYPEEDFLLPFWQQQRAADNLASVYWLYNITGEDWLLKLGEKVYRHTANWTEKVANWHGVNISQSFRGPAVYYQQSHDEKHHAATWQRYRDVMDMYGLVPGGGYGSDENCRKGFAGPRQGTETCTWAELMLSFEQLLKIDGDAKWADRCEEIAFNSLPASMAADLKALHYLTAPNLIACDNKSHATRRGGPGFENPGDMLGFNPHAYRCCQHNVAHAWPYFAEHLWLATPGNGLAAVMYAPCEVRAKAGDGTEVTIVEETKYPFDEVIQFVVHAPKAVRFPLTVRIPAWCQEPRVQLTKGDPTNTSHATGAFHSVTRTWQEGDTLELRLPMSIRVRKWERNANSVSVDRGPLTYALEIGEQAVRYGGTDKWPATEILPTTSWNYALALDADSPADQFTLVNKLWDGAAQPFCLENAPLALQAKARRVSEWRVDPDCGLVADPPRSPVQTAAPEEMITLVPMGCARLRIAAFPTAASDGGAAASSAKH